MQCRPCWVALLRMAETQESLQRAQETPTASKGKNTGAKAQSKSQADRASLWLPMKQEMKISLQQPLL